VGVQQCKSYSRDISLCFILIGFVFVEIHYFTIDLHIINTVMNRTTSRSSWSGASAIHLNIAHFGIGCLVTADIHRFNRAAKRWTLSFA